MRKYAECSRTPTSPLRRLQPTVAGHRAWTRAPVPRARRFLVRRASALALQRPGARCRPARPPSQPRRRSRGRKRGCRASAFQAQGHCQKPRGTWKSPTRLPSQPIPRQRRGRPRRRLSPHRSLPRADGRPRHSLRPLLSQHRLQPRPRRRPHRLPRPPRHRPRSAARRPSRRRSPTIRRRIRALCRRSSSTPSRRCMPRDAPSSPTSATARPLEQAFETPRSKSSRSSTCSCGARGPTRWAG